jgi:hypothetical protein
MPASPRAPAIDQATLSALAAVAAASPIAPQLGSSPTDPPNAQALHKVAVTASQNHPDLLADPHWASLRAYLASAKRS